MNKYVDRYKPCLGTYQMDGWAHDIFFVRHVICSASSHDLANQGGLRVDMHMPYVRREPIRRSSNIVNIYKPPPSPLPPSSFLPYPTSVRLRHTLPLTTTTWISIEPDKSVTYLR